ncbi:MAG: LLM class flavin-dependent oxidoreductase [Pseudorhodoplanes sp.]
MTKDQPSRASNPMFGPHRFKFGLFGYLHEGGNAITTVPERWSGTWEDITKLARMADSAKLDFMIPIARWKGIPGEVHNRLRSFETLTHAAALAGITEHLAVFATVHTPIVHPIFAAKAMVTIDHASRGRAGLNIVCGWNEADLKMFGLQQLEHDKRYEQGAEWFEIWSRIVSGEQQEFDFNGTYFGNMTGIIGQPPSLQRPLPAVITAGYSPAGRDYAVRNSDFLLTIVTDPDHARRELADIRGRERKIGRPGPPLEAIATVYIVCRETRKEAEDYHRYYAEEKADHKGVDFYLAARAPNAQTPEKVMRELRVRWAGGNGAIPLIGTPEDIVEQMVGLQRVGIAGAAVSLVNFNDELPFLIERVMPLMQQAGLRAASSERVRLTGS